MEDLFENTRKLFDKYNDITYRVWKSGEELSDDEDEFLTNFCIYLAHALIKDYGMGGVARDELLRCAKIIEDVIKD